MENKPKKKSKKIIILIIIVVLILLGVAAAIVVKKRMPNGISVEVETVERRDLRQTVEVRGVVSGTDTADVYSKSSNRIAEILVKEGDQVKAGDKLARLEGDSSGITYEKAELDLEAAKREYENNAKLFETGAISEKDFRKIEKEYKNAELTLKGIDTKDDSFVTSPINGTVTRVYTSVGKLAGGTTASSLFLVENIDQLQMKLKVSEYDINKVKLGQPVEITSNVIGEEMVYGKVVSIAPTGERKSENSGEMVVPVTVLIDKDQKGLFAGVNAKASIITGTAENALAVPVDSVMADSEINGNYVLIVKDGILEKCIIDPILEGDFYTAIKDDGAVNEGDEVVLSPDYSMTEGAQVIVQSKAETDGNN